MANVRRIVVKVGTNVLTDPAGRLDKGLIARIARQLALLHGRRLEVTLVTSGAVGAGMGVAGLASRPREMPLLQACAAIGQPSLMTLYAKAMARYNIRCGQLLVTRTDFEQRTRYVPSPSMNSTALPTTTPSLPWCPTFCELI
jgi:glutamate 5-kinase